MMEFDCVCIELLLFGPPTEAVPVRPKALMVLLHLKPVHFNEFCYVIVVSHKASHSLMISYVSVTHTLSANKQNAF